MENGRADCPNSVLLKKAKVLSEGQTYHWGVLTYAIMIDNLCPNSVVWIQCHALPPTLVAAILACSKECLYCVFSSRHRIKPAPYQTNCCDLTRQFLGGWEISLNERSGWGAGKEGYSRANALSSQINLRPRLQFSCTVFHCCKSLFSTSFWDNFYTSFSVCALSAWHPGMADRAWTQK